MIRGEGTAPRNSHQKSCRVSLMKLRAPFPFADVSQCTTDVAVDQNLLEGGGAIPFPTSGEPGKTILLKVI